jgi:hypothetical protein
MGDDVRTIEEAEEYIVTWGKSKFVGLKFSECPNWYLKFIAANFNGLPAKLADALHQWREKNGIKIED